MNVKVSLRVLDTDFEQQNVSYAETYSWQGEKFSERPSNNSKLVHRKKRSLDSEPDRSWAKRTDEPEAGIFIIAESIAIIDDYLIGSPRPPFQFPRQIFIISITNPSEKDFDVICKKVLEKLWLDYAIANVVIITPCCGDPEVFTVSERKIIGKLHIIKFKKKNIFFLGCSNLLSLYAN